MYPTTQDWRITDHAKTRFTQRTGLAWGQMLPYLDSARPVSGIELRYYELAQREGAQYYKVRYGKRQLIFVVRSWSSVVTVIVR